MTTVQHTPGPWTYYKDDQGIYYKEEDGSCGPQIATIFTENCDEEGGEYGDAILITAAPELLAALRNLLTRAQLGLKQDSTHDGLTNCDALAAARRAITKATGEEWTYPPKAKETT